MIDHPDPISLLEAMAKTLDEQVVPATSGGAKHQARVVANLCRIIARELATDDQPTQRDLADLLGCDGDLETLIRELDDRLRDGTAPDNTLPVLLADARRRAEIAKPGYTDA